MKNTRSASSRFSTGWLAPLLLLGLLGLLFWRSFLPGFVQFSNDGPLGQQNVEWLKLPAAMTGMWDDLNDAGFAAGSFTPSVSALVKFLCGPVGYAKFYAPIALFLVGIGAWTFFRALKLSPLAALLGALAATLGSTAFSDACWGTASHQIALGMDFLALALIVANTKETPWLIRWTRFALAGFCVGVNVTEAADIGALYSMVIAIFVFYRSFVDESGGVLTNAVRGVCRVGVVAIFAGFLATQTVVSLVTTQIQGIAGTAQDAETKAANWDKATQWSLPKMETLGLFVPGLFGYKMDTPKDMMPQLQPYYEGGVYWGGMGRSPEIDRFLDNGAQGQMPPGFMRFSGGGEYCGILVCLLAAWTIAQSFRKKDSPFTAAQKKLIWFWTAVLVISLPLAWGRFAPMFYGALYHLPYFSTIRNPAKFVIFFAWALVILFAYGVHALSCRQLNPTTPKSADLASQLKLWWRHASGFDRKWTQTCITILGASVVGWLIFSSEKSSFVAYLEKMGFPEGGQVSPEQIAAFSLGQVGWFILLLIIAITLITLVLSGYFSSSRTRIGSVLLGGFLIFDLGRADLPYIVHWDYKQKYEVGSLNPIVDFLRNKPYEHRVAGLPFRAPEGMELFDQLYRIEWMQHHFPYYNIQCLDLIQMSRMPEDLMAYLQALSPKGTAESAPLIARHWELTNTRYLLGPAGYLEVMNQQLDPEQHRFRIVQRFEVVPKPGILQPTRLEELTAVPNENGHYALFEFTGALPRAKLYSNWQVNTNDQAALKTLADPNFHPAQTVIVDMREKNLPDSATNENSGMVEFKSYEPKNIVFDAQAPAPSVLLLNDKYDPNWHVEVDGKPSELLRCNFLMRGVYLPAGPHTVEFHFTLPSKPLYVTLAAYALAILLSGLLVFLTRKPQTSAAK